MLTGGPAGYQEKHVGVGPVAASLDSVRRESAPQVGALGRPSRVVAHGRHKSSCQGHGRQKPRWSTGAVAAGAVFFMPTRTCPAAGMLRIGGDAQFRAGVRPEGVGCDDRDTPAAAYAVDGWGIRPNCISSETWS